MATISEALAIALRHHQAGRLELAEQVCRSIVAADPDHADTWHLLGMIAFQRGAGPLALECLERAVRLQPDNAAVHYNLGLVVDQHGRRDEAIACYRRAIALNPDYVQAYNNLGLALQQQGHLEEAIDCYRRLLASAPHSAQVLYNLGTALRSQGALEEAANSYRRTLALEPDDVMAGNNLAAVLHQLGQLDEAVACLRRTIHRHPGFAGTYSNLGNVLQDQGRLDEAVACYRRAAELEPSLAGAHSNLGSALREQGRLQEAAACHRRAIELKPDNPLAVGNLGTVLQEQGILDEALACYRQAHALAPDNAELYSSLLLALHYRDDATLASLLHAHVEYEQRYAARLRSQWPTHGNSRDRDRPLRVGFVSADFAHHPVGLFLAPVLEALDRQQCAAICYHGRATRDAVTARCQAAAREWHNVHGLTDQQLAERIRADQIDILVDLAGHTSGNRLPVFARKPAPLAITWLGYAGTTGLRAIDYILADEREIPPGAEAYYSEQVLRMPDGYVCYAPPDDAPPVSALPALTTGYVTFASFNNPAKITGRTVELWSAVLRRVAGSRLLLKYRGWDDAQTQDRYRMLFARHGVAEQRLEFRGWSPHAELLACYAHVDIALDTLVYAGGFTTCEALWMGVPVIALPGETFASRHSLTHLTNVGLATEFVASDPAHFVELAARWANDLGRLAEVRAALRDRMAASPLCDVRRFVAHLLHQLRWAWRRWCDQEGPPDRTRHD